MRSRPWMLLLTAVACGGAAAYLALGVVAGSPRQAVAAPSETRLMVVAARELMPGAVVGANDVKLVAWPAEALPEGYLGSAEAVRGRGVLAALRTNEPLLDSKLSREGAASGLSMLIPAGHRAVSVEVDEVVAVAGFVVPGSRVDVLVTLPAPQPRTRAILQDVPVIAAGQSLQASGGEPQQASVITLLVTPNQAEELALATAQGRIHLALRNGSDRSVARTAGAEVGRLTGGRSPEARPAGRTRTAPAARPGHTIEIYNGNARSVASF